MSTASDTFSTLSPNQKAAFLATVAHFSTVIAREAYAENYDSPDGIVLRHFNEFVHRVTGYIPHVLNQTELPGQDASVIAMIVEEYRARGLEDRLTEWLRRGAN